MGGLALNSQHLETLIDYTETLESALQKVNRLRSNIIATQSAGWSNTIYPLVAILDAAGFEREEVDEASKAEHVNAYGGAGGVPGMPRPR